MPVVVALGSFVTTLLGGVAALRIGDRRHLVLGLAAGLMLGVVLFDLLPEALGEQPGHLFGVPVVMLTAMAGFLTLHVIERSAPVHRGHEREYAGHQHHPGIGLLAASGLVGHSLMDGFAIGAAFQAGTTVAAVVAIAVISHDFADGFNTYTITSLSPGPRSPWPSPSRATYSGSTWGSSPGSCSTWPPPTSFPRRTPATPAASPSSAPSPERASCGW
jgi:zinc transporter ZupT